MRNSTARIAVAAYDIGHENGLVLWSIPNGSDGMPIYRSLEVRCSGEKLIFLALLQAFLNACKKWGEKPRIGKWILSPGTDLTFTVSDQKALEMIQEAREAGLIPETPAGQLLERFMVDVRKAEEHGGKVHFSYAPEDTSSEYQNIVNSKINALLEREGTNAQARQDWQLPEEDAKWVKENGASVVYTDGSCVATKGFSAWGWYMDENHHDVGTVVASTSTYAEARAALEALKAIEGPVLIVADCTHHFDSFSNRTLTRKEERVRKNLRHVVNERQVRILRVPGHAYCPGNIAVDAMVSHAASVLDVRLSKDEILANKLIDLHKQARLDVKTRRAERSQRREQHQERYGSLVPRDKRHLEGDQNLKNREMVLVTA